MKRSELISLCEITGILLIDQGDSVSVDAPTGFILMGIGLHSSTINTHGWKREEVYEDLANDIGGGVEKCTDPDCDSCVKEPMSFDEIAALYRGTRLA